MKKATIILFSVLFPPVQYTYAQSTFENLNFEEANVSGYSPGANNVPISSALPGWSENGQIGPVWYDGISIGGFMISVVDANVPISSFGPIHGNFSAYLFGGSFAPATITQTGLVPFGTHSLQMDIQSQGSPFIVALGGDTLAMVPLKTFPTYTLYGADISSFAGETEQLSLTSPAPTETSPNFLEIDDIVFSPDVIPEQGSWALMLCGAAALMARKSKTFRKP